MSWYLFAFPPRSLLLFVESIHRDRNAPYVRGCDQSQSELRHPVGSSLP